MIPRLLTRLHQVSSEGLANPRMEMPRHSDRNPPTRSTPSKTSNGVPLGPPILMVRAHRHHLHHRLHHPRLLRRFRVEVAARGPNPVKCRSVGTVLLIAWQTLTIASNVMVTGFILVRHLRPHQHRHRLLRHQPRLHPRADALAAHWKLASTCARLTYSPHVQRVARNGALTRMPSSFEPSSDFSCMCFGSASASDALAFSVCPTGFLYMCAWVCFG